MKHYVSRIECECDGSGPCSGTTTKMYKLGAGGNLILCQPCFIKEAKHPHTPIKHQTWAKAKVYRTGIVDDD